MKIAPVAEIKARFSSYLEQCERGPVIVTKNGRPVAVLVSVTDEDELERLVLAHTPRFRKILEAAESRIKGKGGIRHKDFWASVKK
jgi:prevent-host-death family protein